MINLIKIKKNNKKQAKKNNMQRSGINSGMLSSKKCVIRHGTNEDKSICAKYFDLILQFLLLFSSSLFKWSTDMSNERKKSISLFISSSFSDHFYHALFRFHWMNENKRKKKNLWKSITKIKKGTTTKKISKTVDCRCVR